VYVHPTYHANTPAAEATGFFQWVNYASASAPAARPPLFINADETSLAYGFVGAEGTVICAKFIPKEIRQATENASTDQTHGHITYMAMVTHDTSIQPLLPQVLIGNERRFSVSLLREVQHQIPRNVTLLRRPSAWNCHEVMRKIISLLVQALGDLVSKRSVILLLDVHRSHTHPSIFAHARRLGARLIYIPAKLTFLLQPCDTHVFSHLKQRLHDAWRESKSNTTE
jgi:hypothetical protein